MKVEFLRGAPHELKTPLASLKILIEKHERKSAAIRIETTIWELPWGLWMSSITTFSRYFLSRLYKNYEMIGKNRLPPDDAKSSSRIMPLLAKERELQIDNSLNQSASLSKSISFEVDTF